MEKPSNKSTPSPGTTHDSGLGVDLNWLKDEPEHRRSVVEHLVSRDNRMLRFMKFMANFHVQMPKARTMLTRIHWPEEEEKPCRFEEVE